MQFDPNTPILAVVLGLQFKLWREIAKLKEEVDSVKRDLKPTQE